MGPERNESQKNLTKLISNFFQNLLVYLFRCYVIFYKMLPETSTDTAKFM